MTVDEASRISESELAGSTLRDFDLWNQGADFGARVLILAAPFSVHRYRVSRFVSRGGRLLSGDATARSIPPF